MTVKEQKDKIVAGLKKYAAAHKAEYYLVIWTPSRKEKGSTDVRVSYSGERGMIVRGGVARLLLKLLSVGSN
jgi:hypothetical protein